MEICVDVNATEMAKQRAIDLKREEAQNKGKTYKENTYDPKDACLDKMGEDYYYLYKTNSNASDDQSWYIVDKIRIIEILDDDTVDTINDTYYNDLSAKTGRRLNSDPRDYTSKKPNGTPNTDEIPYWKMPRLNGKRFTKQELIDNGYLPQELSHGNW